MESTSVVVFDDYILELILELIWLSVGFGRPMALCHKHNYKLDLAELDRRRPGITLMVYGIKCRVRKYHNPGLSYLYSVKFTVGKEFMRFHFDERHRLVNIDTSNNWMYEEWVTDCCVDDVFVRVRYQKDFNNKPLTLHAKACGPYF